MIEERTGIAIETAEGEAVSYAELFALARRYATSGITYVRAERSIEFIARCLGAWLGGGAFVPVDPDDPRPTPRIETTGLAYAIRTSGSTGKPKLVLVSRRGIPALLRTQVDAFALGPGARALWLHAPMFDASISDWGTALASGATLVIPTRAPVRDEIASRKITHVDLPPSLLPQLADPPACLRVVVLGGEACDVERVQALARKVRTVVVYGPTEATVCSSLVVVDPDRWDRPLIGHPLPGVTYRVIDGELYIGGDALALGYDDAPETARRFVDGMFKTGDRVEETPYGLAFVGRVDRQRKIAGRRIELDEIEAVVSRFARCAVVARGQRIVAFVEGQVPDLRPLLPSYMVPRVVTMTLPRTSTGKIDRAALEHCELPPARIDFTDPLERELAQRWCDAIGVDRVSDERWAAAGGDSLARMMFDDGLLDGDPTFWEVVARARQRTHRTVAWCEAQIPEVPIEHVERRGKRILVTGAAGFLGRRLVARLPDAIAFTRADGDITLPYFGLSRERWLELATRIGAVIHCAAVVKLGGSWDDHVAANLHGTAEVMRIAHGIPFHYISTLSVFAGTDRVRGHHAPTDVADGIAYGGYAQTKIAAEALVRGRAHIYRLGLLVGGEQDQLAMTIRGLRLLGAFPEGFADESFDETPVDFAADAIARQARHAARLATPGVHHIAAGSTTGRALRERLDLPLLAEVTWRERARRRLDHPDIAMAHASFSRRPELELFRATGATW